MERDNWKHRAVGMRCKTCMWFVEKQAQVVHKVDGSEEKRVLGRCRKRAPELGGWPAVFDSDWCGDHKLDETKIER
jgi:hypothetical protein